MNIYSSHFLNRTYTDEDVAYVEYKRDQYGVMYQLKHPFTDEYMFFEGDCVYCDSHDSDNMMCVSSLPKYSNNYIFSVCSQCLKLHNFITFNHGSKIVNIVGGGK